MINDKSKGWRGYYVGCLKESAWAFATSWALYRFWWSEAWGRIKAFVDAVVEILSFISFFLIVPVFVFFMPLLVPMSLLIAYFDARKRAAREDREDRRKSLGTYQ